MDLDAFAAALRDGLEKERALRWDEAATLYADLVRKAPDPTSRALALLRHGNALLELRRWDDARTAFDAGLHEAKASGDADVLAQALLAAGVFAASRNDAKRAEAGLVDDRQGMKAKADRLRALLGRKRV